MTTDPESMFAAWCAALASDEALDRCDAAESPPGDVAPARVVSALIPLLDDPSDLVRASAAESLGLYPGTEAAKALRAYVTAETDALARAYALSSLGLVGSLGDVDVLLGALAQDEPPHVEIYALAGLHELVRRLAKQGLATYLAHEQPAVRSAAAEALGDVVRERDDGDALEALRAQLAREPAAGRRADLRAVIVDVWGEGAVDAPEQD